MRLGLREPDLAHERKQIRKLPLSLGGRQRRLNREGASPSFDWQSERAAGQCEDIWLRSD